MSLSYSENATLICPTCGQRFVAEVWMLLDAAERPDLAEALREGGLNVVGCPHCGNRSPAGAPLLFHDAASRRVYFAAPPDAAEHELREQAQSLLYRLIGAIPEEERHPYLGDVQVEQGVEGVHRALRRQRARGRTAAARPPPAPARGAAHHVVDVPPEPPPEPTPLLDALQALIAADSPAEFATIVGEHPVLLGASADAALAQLAEVQGDPTIAAALREVRAQLARMRGTIIDHRTGVQLNAPTTDDLGSRPGLVVEERGSLSDVAYQALLMVASVDELRAALSDHPALLEDWADDDLLLRVESALDAGDERLAADIEERREVLAALREELSGAAALPQAIKALLAADGEDALAAALGEHPILLTGMAQDALAELAAEARTRGDDGLADYAEQRRTMLRNVRAGLDDV
jgi:CpXC protein